MMNILCKRLIIAHTRSIACLSAGVLFLATLGGCGRSITVSEQTAHDQATASTAAAGNTDITATTAAAGNTDTTASTAAAANTDATAGTAENTDLLGNVTDIENATASAGSATNQNADQALSSANSAKLTPLERYYKDDDFWKGCPKRNVQLLTPNEYSRPGTGIDEVHDIVVHYVDEPGSTAMQNRDYFESLKDGSGRSVSSHFVISLDGEIVQCVPLGEVAYASNHRNRDTISIECCHPDETGEFTEETYRSCVNLCAWLCYAFEITPDHVIRHYDVTEKICPKYYVEHPDAWEYMKMKIAEKYDEYETEFGKRI